MPDIVRSKPAAAQRPTGVHVPGIYRAFIRANAAWRAQPDDRDIEHLTDEQYEAAHRGALATGDCNADEEIAFGNPLLGLMIRRQRLLHPYQRGFFSVPNLVAGCMTFCVTSRRRTSSRTTPRRRGCGRRGAATRNPVGCPRCTSAAQWGSS